MSAVPPPAPDPRLPRPAEPEGAHAPGTAGRPVAPIRPKEELLSLFHRMSARIARPAEQTRLLLWIADEAARLMRAAGAALAMREPAEPALLRIRAGSGLLADHENGILPADASFAGAATLRRTALVTPDLSHDGRAFRRHEGEHAGPACALPLLDAGVVLGVLLVIRAPGAPPFGGAEIDVLQLAGDGFGAALAAAARFEQARDARAEIDLVRRLRQDEGWRDAYRAAADAERLVVFRWDPFSDTFLWGATLRPVFGHGEQEFGVTTEAWLAHVGHQDREPVRQALQRARADEASASVDCVVRHASGAFRRARLEIFPASEPGAPVRSGAIRDITGAADAEALRDAASNGTGELVHRIRHEINNPLAAVLGQLQLLEREPAVARDPAVRDAVRTLQVESARIRDVLRRLQQVE